MFRNENPQVSDPAAAPPMSAARTLLRNIASNYLGYTVNVVVTLLLTRVSGVPLLEKRADATWGGQPDYEAYKASTPVLIPRPPRR